MGFRKFFIVAASLLVLVVGGCSTVTPKRAGDTAEFGSVSVTFPANYVGRRLVDKPVSWTDYYDGGTYLFMRGRYSEATDYFLGAADRASGEAMRTCLAAAAVCALADDNTLEFEAIMDRFGSLADEDQDPFSEPTRTDGVIGVLSTIKR